MRKLIVFCHISLDGIAAVDNGNLGWVSYDKDLEKWAEPIVAKTDTAMYGRNTYELMRNYWPTVLTDPNSTEHEFNHAKWIENVEKIVFSKSLEAEDWNNTRIIKDNIKEEILKLKEKLGKNITIFGSPTLVNSLIDLDVVDEFQLSVNPILLGDGKFLFKGLKKQIKLKLIGEQIFESGTATFHYAVQ